MSIACNISSQIYANGFCFDPCPAGQSPVGDVCVFNCPEGFLNRGEACEPPSFLRKPVKSYLAPCAPNEIDQNGNCYEPQVVSYITGPDKTQIAKVSGCGCIKKTLDERVQCPKGFSRYNNGCVTECPPGFTDIKDDEGRIKSLYCTELCPLKENKKNERWQNIGGLCVKEYKKRIATKEDTVVADTKQYAGTFGTNPVYGLPSTMSSYLASRPLGSSLQDRYRAGQSIQNNLSTSPDTNPFQNALGTSWLSLFFNPSRLALALIIFGLLIFGAPYLFPLLAQGFGSVVKGLGLLTASVETGAGKVIEGAASGAGQIIESTGGVLADIETSVGKNVAAAIATPASRLEAVNAARPVQAQREALEELIGATREYQDLLRELNAS